MGDVALSIEVCRGDITAAEVDVIVNAANSTLVGGGGVDGAIHRAAGPRLLEECRRVRKTRLPQGLGVGEAVATGAGNLPARWVVHTVGPNLNRGQSDPMLLRNAFRNSLLVAAGLGATSVAFPAISAGAFGWPRELVAHHAVSVVRTAASEEVLGAVELVRFVLFDAATEQAFARELSAANDPES